MQHPSLQSTALGVLLTMCSTGVVALSAILIVRVSPVLGLTGGYCGMLLPIAVDLALRMRHRALSLRDRLTTPLLGAVFLNWPLWIAWSGFAAGLIVLNVLRRF